MTAKKIKKEPSPNTAKEHEYSAFDQINGWHPWQDQVPEGYINYSVRNLPNGEVAYFNFDLAIDMGILPKDHPRKLNKKLKNKILEAFNIRIINEYDIEKKVKYDEKTIKENQFMATRYLQLQHANKQGKTSGDGRSVWNGIHKNGRTVWDVSSRGTGVTALSPGAVEAGTPLKSGSTDFGYGCGLADIDELYSSALMSEILHNNDFTTERTLAIIDHGKNIGIGIRAGKNLLRPAHLFALLKQENYEALKRATDYFINRQSRNGEWTFKTDSKLRYKYMLEEICESFAQFAAQMERDYIFAWLDWDGDNVLANAGIIDYGSIRVLGLRHDQYRFDDVQRFSTTLNEQKSKAKLTVQVFIQLAEYLRTKEKKALKDFNAHPILNKFDEHFDYYVRDRFLFQVGLPIKKRQWLLTKHRELVDKLYRPFYLLEKKKTHRSAQKTDDGVNRPAIFNMRKLLREFSTAYIQNEMPLAIEESFKIMLAADLRGRDKIMTDTIGGQIKDLSEAYMELLEKLEAKDKNQLHERSQQINKATRVTGDAMVFVTEILMKEKKKGMSADEVQKVMDTFVAAQITNPDAKGQPEPKRHPRKAKAVVDFMLEVVDDYKESL